MFRSKFGVTKGGGRDQLNVSTGKNFTLDQEGTLLPKGEEQAQRGRK